MSLSKILMAIAAITMMVLSSCTGGDGNESEALLFGEIPAIHGEMQEAKAAVKEEYKACDSESKAKTLMEKASKLEEEYSQKIETASKNLEGKEINFADGDVKVTSPISLTFEKFFSKSDMTPYFKVNGSAEVSKDIIFDCTYPAFYVNIVGYGSDGQELYSSRIGTVDAIVGDNSAVVKAGTPIKFDKLQFAKSKVAEYQQAVALKIEVRKD